MDRDLTGRIAKLARLELSQAEAEVFGSQIRGILRYVEKLGELDTADVEPTSHIIDIVNVTRDDYGIPSLAVSSALSNAPEATEKFYRVPKIIE